MIKMNQNLQLYHVKHILDKHIPKGFKLINSNIYFPSGIKSVWVIKNNKNTQSGKYFILYTCLVDSLQEIILLPDELKNFLDRECTLSGFGWAKL